MARGLPWLALAAILLCGAGPHDRAAAPRPDDDVTTSRSDDYVTTSRSDDYVVYRAVLEEVQPREGRLILIPSEARLPERIDVERFLRILPLLANVAMTPALEEACRAFAGAGPVALEDRFDLATPHRLLPVQEAPPAGSPDWDRVVVDGGADGLTWLTPIGYSRDGTVAFTALWFQEGEHGQRASGGQFILQRSEDGWQVARRVWMQPALRE